MAHHCSLFEANRQEDMVAACWPCQGFGTLLALLFQSELVSIDEYEFRVKSKAVSPEAKFAICSRELS